MRLRDARLVPVDKDSGVGNVLRQKDPWPDLAISMRSCFERMVYSTSRVEAVDKNKARGNV